ncbi:MAG: IclR family transcriptional regulator [Actinomycetota bacterium]
MKSARNVIDVVELLAGDGPLGLSELARRSEIPKSTVQRCIDTLVDAGWIESAHDPRHGTRTAWALTAHVAGLGPPGPVDLVGVARPVAARLAAELGDAVHVVGLDGTDVVLLERLDGDGPVRVVLPVGFRVPAHAAATGKAMLAHLPDELVGRHLPARLRALTDATITTRSMLFEELATIRARGWATNHGEWEPSVVAVAAPILRRDAGSVSVLGALSVSATPQRWEAGRMDAVGVAVRGAADEIAGRLRSVPASPP